MSTQVLRHINARINRAIRYVPDVTDHWQTPSETQRRGTGDCEDYAIAKLAAVLSAGYPPGSARLVYCRRTLGRTSEAHMVLEVWDRDDWRVLDNLGYLISRWDERTDLRPLFSFTATGFWVKGQRVEVDPQQRLGQWERCCERARDQGDWLGW